MVKKFSFNDKLGHTDMVLSGRKTAVILPAPALPASDCSYRIKAGKLMFISLSDKMIASHRLPLVPGLEYAVCRPYRELFPDGRPEDYGYGWNDKRTVPVRDLPDKFRVLSAHYMAVPEVAGEQWQAACMETESLEGIFGYMPEYVYVIEIEMTR